MSNRKIVYDLKGIFPIPVSRKSITFATENNLIVLLI